MNDDSRGLQSERTAMAWQRTALGLGGVSALLLRHAEGRVGASVPGALGLVVALALLLRAEIHHERHHGDSDNAPMGRGAVRDLTVATVLLSLASTVVVLTGPG